MRKPTLSSLPHRASALLLVVGLLAGGLACGTDPDDLGRCDPPLSITVRTTPFTEFSWEPSGCDLYTLSVDHERQAQWYLFTIETRNSLTSPVRYGVTPSGANSSNAEPLLSGRRYTLELTRLDAGNQLQISRQEFNYP